MRYDQRFYIRSFGKLYNDIVLHLISSFLISSVSRDGKRCQRDGSSDNFAPSIMEEFHMSVIDVIHSSDHRRIFSMTQMINVQRMADLFDAVLHVQA